MKKPRLLAVEDLDKKIRLLTLEDLDNMPDEPFREVHNTRDIQVILNDLPDDLPAYSIELRDVTYTVLVDSAGNAQKIPNNSPATLVFYVEVPHGFIPKVSAQ